MMTSGAKDCRFSFPWTAQSELLRCFPVFCSGVAWDDSPIFSERAYNNDC